MTSDFDQRCWSYADLRFERMRRVDIESALSTGMLFRARRDVYIDGRASRAVKSAARVGGRLDCVSAMRELGVFVRDAEALHVQVEPNRKHLRSPTSRRVRLEAEHGVVVHWRAELEAAPRSLLVPPIPALARAIACQDPRSAIATIDSALHLRVVSAADLGEVFALLPERYGVLRKLVDGRAEAGPETIARLLLRGLGCRVEVQKLIDGVGRVDLVVDGWLIVECDSRAHHSGWEAQERDRVRDLAAAARGFTCIRPSARIIFQEPEVLIRAVQGLRDARDAQRRKFGEQRALLA